MRGYQVFLSWNYRTITCVLNVVTEIEMFPLFFEGGGNEIFTRIPKSKDNLNPVEDKKMMIDGDDYNVDIYGLAGLLTGVLGVCTRTIRFTIIFTLS